MLKVLIADSGEEFRQALAEQLQMSYIVRTSREGKRTQEIMREFRPDILVLDLMLPGMDGISLLQAAAEEGIRPMVLATTSFFNDYVLQSVERLGVGYVMVKPCDIKATAMRVADLTAHIVPPVLAQPDTRTVVTNLLLALSIPTKLKGFACLREAILEAMRDPGQPVTKELYPAVAKLCDGNAVQVEHLIRSAISAGWKRRDEKIWRLYFRPNQAGELERPTNASFIFCIASYLAVSRGMQRI